MSTIMPVLAQQEDMRIVWVDGQPVVTARDLARALEYKEEGAIRIILHRNRESFKERGCQIETPFKNSELKYDTGEVELDTPGGRQRIRYFTKRGALKVIMKSNQPRAVAVQEALIDLYEQVERGELVSAGYLQDAVRELRAEIGRLRGLLPAAKVSNDLRVVYVSRRQKPRSFDDEALAFLQKLFNSRPHDKVVDLDRQLRCEAAKNGWKVGSPDSVYRTLKNWRRAACGFIQ